MLNLLLSNLLSLFPEKEEIYKEEKGVLSLTGYQKENIKQIKIGIKKS